MIYTAGISTVAKPELDSLEIGYEWKCSCGASRSYCVYADPAKYATLDKMKEALRHQAKLSCERGLDDHIAGHVQLPSSRVHVHEDPESDADAPPDAQRTDDVRHIRPTRPGDSQDPERAALIATMRAPVTASRRDITYLTSRWDLFTENELRLLMPSLKNRPAPSCDESTLRGEIRDALGLAPGDS